MPKGYNKRKREKEPEAYEQSNTDERANKNARVIIVLIMLVSLSYLKNIHSLNLLSIHLSSYIQSSQGFSGCLLDHKMKFICS